MTIQSLHLDFSEIKRVEVQRYSSGRITIWLWGAKGGVQSIYVYNEYHDDNYVDITITEWDGTKTKIPTPNIPVELADAES